MIYYLTKSYLFQIDIGKIVFMEIVKSQILKNTMCISWNIHKNQKVSLKYTMFDLSLIFEKKECIFRTMFEQSLIFYPSEIRYRKKKYKCAPLGIYMKCSKQSLICYCSEISHKKEKKEKCISWQIHENRKVSLRYTMFVLSCFLIKRKVLFEHMMLNLCTERVFEDETG